MAIEPVILVLIPKTQGILTGVKKSLVKEFFTSIHVRESGDEIQSTFFNINYT